MQLCRLIAVATLSCAIGACVTQKGQRTQESDAHHDVFAEHHSVRSPDYVRPVPEEKAKSVALGHFQDATAPNGQQTQIWVPENSYQLGQGEQPSGYRPFNAPRLDEPYSAAKGRYATLRYPDGRLEYQWMPDEPSSPVAGFWQMLPDDQRVWVSGGQSTIASER